MVLDLDPDLGSTLESPREPLDTLMPSLHPRSSPPEPWAQAPQHLTVGNARAQPLHTSSPSAPEFRGLLLPAQVPRAEQCGPQGLQRAGYETAFSFVNCQGLCSAVGHLHRVHSSDPTPSHKPLLDPKSPQGGSTCGSSARLLFWFLRQAPVEPAAPAGTQCSAASLRPRRSPTGPTSHPTAVPV